jgi:hypothetical protein
LTTASSDIFLSTTTHNFTDSIKKDMVGIDPNQFNSDNSIVYNGDTYRVESDMLYRT